jgi:N-acyl-L-homoserine lactone synthetase
MSATNIGQSRVDDVRALLYRVYHVEQGWSPPVENPSQQAIVQLDRGSPGLADRFDHSATWLGLLCDERIVGCIRLIDRADHPQLELESYFALPSRLSCERLIEVNRLAILPAYRRSTGTLLLIERALEIAARNGCALITATTRPTARHLTLLTGIVDTGLRFRYHESDDHAAVLVLPASSVERQRLIIEDRLSKCHIGSPGPKGSACFAPILDRDDTKLEPDAA